MYVLRLGAHMIYQLLIINLRTCDRIDVHYKSMKERLINSKGAFHELVLSLW